MLGFDQANPGPDAFRNSPKIGPKEARGFARAIAQSGSGDDSPGIAQNLQAKVGNKPRGTGALQAKIGIKGVVTR
ncbi:MAG: hypothetical protein WD715_06480 [Dongiaceae bacterium]